MVVNNAGGTFRAPLLDVSTKGEAALIAENFTQVTHLVREAVPHMPDGGSIVNVTSIEAHRAAPGFAVYAAMKAAQANLTQSLALELAPRGIRVNAMAPDVLETEGTGSLVGTRGPGAGGATGSGYDAPPAPPLGHWGTARDGAGPILFLASDLARFVTGVTAARRRRQPRRRRLAPGRPDRLTSLGRPHPFGTARAPPDECRMRPP